MKVPLLKIRVFHPLGPKLNQSFLILINTQNSKPPYFFIYWQISIQVHSSTTLSFLLNIYKHCFAPWSMCTHKLPFFLKILQHRPNLTPSLFNTFQSLVIHNYGCSLYPTLIPFITKFILKEVLPFF